MKSTLGDLAVFGGERAFPEDVHVGRPNLGDTDDFLVRVKDMLDRNWLSNDGPFVREFEQRVREHVGVRHCVAMCNGTVALEIAVRAAGLAGEVIVPSFTFVATAHALQWQEITPVFCDIDPRTHTIDPAQVEALITPRTTGIVGVHLWGRPCEVEALDEVARRHDLVLLFDAAHAFSCSHGGTMVGNFGRAEIFSFHATKFLNTFEGGAVVTNDDDLAARMDLMRNFGFAGYDNVVHIGTNGKMSEVAAAMGLTSLDAIDGFIDANRANYQSYRAGLVGIPGVRLLEHPDGERRNFQYVVVEVSSDEATITRDRLVELLWAEGVHVRRYFHPGAHRMEPYRSKFPDAGRSLPQTEKVCTRVLVLPTGTATGAVTIERVCELIRFAVEHGEEIEGRLADLGGEPRI